MNIGAATADQGIIGDWDFGSIRIDNRNNQVNNKTNKPGAINSFIGGLKSKISSILPTKNKQHKRRNFAEITKLVNNNDGNCEILSNLKEGEIQDILYKMNNKVKNNILSQTEFNILQYIYQNSKEEKIHKKIRHIILRSCNLKVENNILSQDEFNFLQYIYIEKDNLYEYKDELKKISSDIIDIIIENGKLEKTREKEMSESILTTNLPKELNTCVEEIAKFREEYGSKDNPSEFLVKKLGIKKIAKFLKLIEDEIFKGKEISNEDIEYFLNLIEEYSEKIKEINIMEYLISKAKTLLEKMQKVSSPKINTQMKEETIITPKNDETTLQTKKVKNNSGINYEELDKKFEAKTKEETEKRSFSPKEDKKLDYSFKFLEDNYELINDSSLGYFKLTKNGEPIDVKEIYNILLIMYNKVNDQKKSLSDDEFDILKYFLLKKNSLYNNSEANKINDIILSIIPINSVLLKKKKEHNPEILTQRNIDKETVDKVSDTISKNNSTANTKTENLPNTNKDEINISETKKSTHNFYISGNDYKLTENRSYYELTRNGKTINKKNMRTKELGILLVRMIDSMGDKISFSEKNGNIIIQR